MARSHGGWFQFGDTASSDLGIQVMDGRGAVLGEARGAEREAAGRDGGVWIGDGAARSFEIRRRCRLRASRWREAEAWLRGAGRLTFSREADAAYDARVVKKLEAAQVAPGSDPLMEFTVTFLAQPHPRMLPEAPATEIAASGTTLVNPGAGTALPRVTIWGQGDFTLAIGGSRMYFYGVEAGVTVDSELGDALDLAGTELRNGWVCGELFRIAPGPNRVEWAALEDGESPGTVTRVKILPRWRHA